MNTNWLSIWTSRLASLADRLSTAAARPGHFGESWELDVDHRRAMRDLEAVRVRFPDHA